MHVGMVVVYPKNRSPHIPIVASMRNEIGMWANTEYVILPYSHEETMMSRRLGAAMPTVLLRILEINMDFARSALVMPAVLAIVTIAWR